MYHVAECVARRTRDTFIATIYLIEEIAVKNIYNIKFNNIEVKQVKLTYRDEEQQRSCWSAKLICKTKTILIKFVYTRQ